MPSGSASRSVSESRASPARRAAGGQADQASAEHEPGRVHAIAGEQDGCTSGERRGGQVDQGSPGEVPGDDDEQREGGDVDAVEQGAGGWGASQPRNERRGRRDEDEGGKEDAERRDQRAARAAEQIADEGGGREDRPGRDLSHRHGIEQLRLAEPVPPIDQVRAKKGEEHVAAPEENGSDLQEEEE